MKASTHNKGIKLYYSYVNDMNPHNNKFMPCYPRLFTISVSFLRLEFIRVRSLKSIHKRECNRLGIKAK